jgi:hypothetical protein
VLRKVAPPAREDLEPLLQAREQRLRRDHLDAGGRELDRQRQPIKASADLGNDSSVFGGDSEISSHRASSLQKQVDSLIRLGLVCGISRRTQSQRRHRVLMLARNVQRGSARREHLETRGRSEKFANHGGGGQQMLEIVEDEEHLLLGQVSPDRGFEGLPGYFAQAQRLRHRRWHEFSRRYCRKLYEEESVFELVDQIARRMKCEPRLARATRPRERYEPNSFRAQERGQLREFMLAADQRGRLNRQIGRPVPERLQRRKFRR